MPYPYSVDATLVVPGDRGTVSSVATAIERIRAELPSALREVTVAEVGSTSVVTLDAGALAAEIPMVRSVEFRLRNSGGSLHASYCLVPARAPAWLVPLSATAFFGAIAAALAVRGDLVERAVVAVAAVAAILGGCISTALWWRSCRRWPQELLTRALGRSG